MKKAFEIVCGLVNDFKSNEAFYIGQDYQECLSYFKPNKFKDHILETFAILINQEKSLHHEPAQTFYT